MILRFLVLVGILLLPGTASASPCWGKIIAANQPPVSNKEVRLAIFPFENFTKSAEDRWIAYAIPLLLNEYLSLGKKVGVIPPDPEWWNPTFKSQEGVAAAQALQATHLILGRLFREGEKLQIETLFMSAPDGRELQRVNGVVEFPGVNRLNDLLIQAINAYSQAEKKLGLKTKIILPYLHTTNSTDSLRFYVAGTLLLLEGAPEKAINKFEEAIKLDYNYVPGYLGLAEALVSTGLIRDIQGNRDISLWQRARLELERAKLLLPPYTERKGALVERYLQAYIQKESANNRLAEGNLKKGLEEFSKVVRLLPGDLQSQEKLLESAQKTGNIKQAAVTEKAIEALNGCGNGSP